MTEPTTKLQLDEEQDQFHVTVPSEAANMAGVAKGDEFTWSIENDELVGRVVGEDGDE